ncbi:MAG: hypothetical protein ACR2KL_01570 [Nocardioidaceae bacterium]
MAASFIRTYSSRLTSTASALPRLVNAATAAHPSEQARGGGHRAPGTDRDAGCGTAGQQRAPSHAA